jgi:ASC-1-like (ASCH) protein
MIIEDQTVEVKVWDHNDAVIFVYENIHEKTGELHEDVPVWKSYKNVVTAIPVNFVYCDSLSNDDKLEKVRKVADALTELYGYEDGNEMGVSYYINHDQYVNA